MRAYDACVWIVRTIRVCTCLRNLYELTNTSQQISFLFLSSRKSYFVSKLGSLYSTSLYGPKRNEVREEVFYYVSQEQLSFLAYCCYDELVVQRGYNL
jgi:hypothetical protein